MSAEFDVDLSALEGDFDDVSLTDADEYQDETGPAPLQPGTYRFAVVETQLKKNQDGELITDNGYPVFQVNRVRIVEPVEYAGREAFPFQSYSLKPVSGGSRAGSVPAVDLLRAFDDSLTFGNGREVLQLLGEQIARGGTFVADTNWMAKDSSYIKDAIANAGGDLDNMSEDERRELFKAAIIRSQKKFPKVNGFYIPEWEGPSGEAVPARVSLRRLYPSSKDVKKLGPFGVKKQS